MIEYKDEHGRYHRIDGPAIEWSDGDKAWYIEGVEYTEEEFEAKTKEPFITIPDNNNLTRSLSSMNIGDLKVIKHKDKVYLGFKESSVNLRLWESGLLLIDKGDTQ